MHLNTKLVIKTANKHRIHSRIQLQLSLCIRRCWFQDPSPTNTKILGCSSLLYKATKYLHTTYEHPPNIPVYLKSSLDYSYVIANAMQILCKKLVYCFLFFFMVMMLFLLFFSLNIFHHWLEPVDIHDHLYSVKP